MYEFRNFAFADIQGHYVNMFFLYGKRHLIC